MVELSDHMLGIAQDESQRLSLSPFVPYALYQTAVIQLRLWEQNGKPKYKENLQLMVTLLDCFSQRWSIAGE